MKHMVLLCLAILILLAQACGASPAELTATAGQALALTQTAAPTTPQPDPRAMIDWQSIGLPQGYITLSPSTIGIEEDAVAFDTSMGTFKIAGSFVFASPDKSAFVYGYTIKLDPGDEDFADAILSAPEQAIPLSEQKPLAIGQIGDGSAATSGLLGEGVHADIAIFRIDDVLGIVFVSYPEGQPAPVEAEVLSHVYAESLVAVPAQSCRIVSIIPVENAAWPAIDFQAEGFYPSEGRFAILSADVTIEGTIQNVATVQAGLTGEHADSQGMVEGNITLTTDFSGENVSPPAELELKVVGLVSNCEAVQTVVWPGQ